MKKLFSTLILSALFLSACQNAAAPLDNAAEQAKQEKASAESKVSLTIKGDSPNVQDTSVKLSNVTVEGMMDVDTMGTSSDGSVIDTGKRGVALSAGGFAPDSVDVALGKDFMIYNNLSKTAQLYTTTDGKAPCPTIGATVEIPSGQSKIFTLDKAMTCTILNQEITSQKVVVTVK